MKKITLSILAIAGMAASNMSTAASFQDETTTSSTISFSSPTGPITLKITPRTDLTSGDYQESKRLASISVKSTDNTQNLGIRWSPSNTNQILLNNNYTAKIINENGDILYASFNIDGLTETNIGNDTYFVKNSAGGIATDIISEGQQNIVPGNYVVTFDASSYTA
ncbi:hypothetical protein ELK40_00605 (plasmid) [Enterobacter sp. N18-03635]|uniref:hypothetical protein n=1 Tax=Enterobacter sp. N18-03635 TaxID=2500132 RepID=UPI000FD7B671|nr:hypothetical protein [Enterobacter sp. N18-03635]AZV03707.1 hypothetical protein ELK40_00605 [Enterobacter sp. N18-03635]